MAGESKDKARLLIVEDDEALAALMLEYLGMHWFELSHVTSGNAGVEAILQTQPDLVILDLMLPGMSGLDVCREVRDAYSGAILMLTASQSEADHVAGLELGADDFVTKPIEPRVLVARIRKQLSRLQVERAPNTGHDNGILDIGSLRLDVNSRSVHVKGQNVPVTTMEFDILEILVREAGTVVKREDLYTRVLGTQYNGIDRGLDVHMSRIRRKLQQVDFDTGRLKSIRSVGYLLANR